MPDRILNEHLERYPLMRVQDAVKLLHQRVMGAGHMVRDAGESLRRITDEMKRLSCAPSIPVEEIGRGMCRVHLGAPHEVNWSIAALNRLFVFGANLPAGSMEEFFEAADILWQADARGGGRFSQDELRESLHGFLSGGTASISHSREYREAYRPAYRVMPLWFATLLPLVTRIDACIQEKGRAIIAIDGNCCAGKSTLAALLRDLYHHAAAIIPMDHFFLPAQLRTAERYGTPGGNIQYERFLEEAAPGIQKGGAFSYRPFDCQSMSLTDKRLVPDVPLLIVEGSYSHHPALRALYDVRVFLSILPLAQSIRLHGRETAQMQRRFFEEWIPMENAYFEAFSIRDQADFILQNAK